jgi:hypothetical protein
MKLGGSELLRDKIEKLQSVARNLCPENIEDYFLSEYKKENGTRVLENFWFFSPKYVLESKKIIQIDFNIDIMCIDEFIDRYEIDCVNYIFNKATENSKLTITAYTTTAVLVMNASGFNCDKLWHIFETYIKPNLYKCE